MAARAPQPSAVSTVTLERLRRFAVARSLFPTTTLAVALQRFGFVQADPIRAPARAQDLTLRHRVQAYRAGDLERLYPTIDIEEDFFVNYGFVTRELHDLMHPRRLRAWPPSRRRQADAILAFVRERGPVHPRTVDEHFAHGTVTNYWGGSSNATTHLLDALHYSGALRVVGRERGIRLYAARERPPLILDPTARRARVDRLVDIVVGLYAPLPLQTLSRLISRLRHAAPQWAAELPRALQRAIVRLPHVRIDGVDWFWPSGEDPVRDSDAGDTEVVRLLSPFDPVVWDRRRFELFWGWAYRFEAYTPIARRTLGYYALPLLWRDRIIGWGNLTASQGRLQAALGYVGRRPRGRSFTAALDDELARIRAFLALEG